MKKTLTNILLIIATIVVGYILYNMFCSCDDVKTNTKYIKGDSTVVIDTFIIRDTLRFYDTDTLYLNAKVRDSVATTSFEVNALTVNDDTANVSGVVSYSYPDSLFSFMDLVVKAPTQIKYVIKTISSVDTLVYTQIVKQKFYKDIWFYISFLLAGIIYLITQT